MSSPDRAARKRRTPARPSDAATIGARPARMARDPSAGWRVARAWGGTVPPMWRGVTGARMRGIALLPLGALAVHQGRYYAAFGGQADLKLGQQGHGYLGDRRPARLPAARRGRRRADRPALARVARRATPAPADRADTGTLKTWVVDHRRARRHLRRPGAARGSAHHRAPGGPRRRARRGRMVRHAHRRGGRRPHRPDAARRRARGSRSPRALRPRSRGRAPVRAPQPFAIGLRRRRAPLADRLAGRAPPADASLIA